MLARRIDGQRLVYLDSAATSLTPERVLQAELSYYRRHRGTVHRGIHSLAVEATEAYEHSRQVVAEMLGVAPEQVVFTRSATASLNTVARGLEQWLQAGDEILLTEMEHHANLVPWVTLARRCGAVIKRIGLGLDGVLDLSQLDGLLGPRTKIVALTHVSNVLGTVNPVAVVAERAHAHGALVVVDAAQSAGHLQVELGALGADFVAFSGHKMYGPTGVGVLAGRTAALELLDPMETGGEMIDQVDFDAVSFAALPHRLEAGTPNIAGVIALAAAIELIDELGLAALREHEQRLTALTMRMLDDLPGVHILGPRDPEQRGGLVAFHDPQVHPHDLAALLDQRGVAVRAGHHCAQPLHRALGLSASTRASFAAYSGEGDVEALIDGMRYARALVARH